jgi:ferredoxin, 2Fe-2S
MPRIVFVEHTGAEHTVECRPGESFMQAAVENAVPGIMADCNGALACGTCQGYVDAPWFTRLPPKSAEEAAMLECNSHLRENSRLTCQLTMKDELDGIVVRLPESQY